MAKLARIVMLLALAQGLYACVPRPLDTAGGRPSPSGGDWPGHPYPAAMEMERTVRCDPSLADTDCWRVPDVPPVPLRVAAVPAPLPVCAPAPATVAPAKPARPRKPRPISRPRPEAPCVVTPESPSIPAAPPAGAGRPVSLAPAAVR